jgi:hypothetical protein
MAGQRLYVEALLSRKVPTRQLLLFAASRSFSAGMPELQIAVAYDAAAKNNLSR